MRPTIGNISNSSSGSSGSGSGNATRMLLFSLFLAFAFFVTSNRKCWDFSQDGSDIKSKQQLTVNLNNGEYFCLPSKAPRPIKTRLDLGYILEELNFTTGAEVGVKQANFARATLSRWPSCQHFKLIDLWGHQDNHDNLANVPDDIHNKFYQDAQNMLEPWRNITQFYRMYSSEAANRIKKESLDYIYMDARHDYCGALEDFTNYWPLLKPGGIMAGHDFLHNDEVQGQDRSLCMDGVTVKHDAVKGAVLDFFHHKLGLMIGVAYMQTDFPSWYVQKPVLCGDTGNDKKHKKGKAKN